MGIAVKTEVILNARILSDSRFVLFRPKIYGERQPWRQQFINRGVKVPIPPSFFPQEAELRSFSSFEQARRIVNNQWGRVPAREFAAEFEEISEKLSVSPASIRLFGFSVHAKKSSLQNVHLLLFAEHPKTILPASCFPVVTAVIKAPWNNIDEKTRIKIDEWRRCHRGIDLAVLVHAIQVYFKLTGASLNDESIAMTKLLLASRDSRVLDFARMEDKAADLKYDMMIFNVRVAEIPKKQFDFLPGNYTVWGFDIDGVTSARLVRTYHGWIKAIFGPMSTDSTKI
jgi:succinate dehydrogenase flavin-adding protein (antitoxin of CptAB toxin-antitoxin module)